MWSAAFSRNLEAKFEIFVGVYSSKRCKSLWGATGPMCHAALRSAEILGGRSGLSVLKKDLWERRKGSWCQISPFFPPLWGIHPAPMTSALISSDAFFQSSFPSHHHISQPAALSLLQIPVLVWMKYASFFSPGQLVLSSAFNIILPCSFKSGEHFWPFPFFLLARIQKYNLCCDAFSFTIFKSFRLPVQSTRIFIEFSSPHVLIIRFCISFPISLAQTWLKCRISSWTFQHPFLSKIE